MTLKDLKSRLAKRLAGKTPRKSEQGFTLVEVLVTLVIIGLLTAVVVANVLPAQDKAMAQKSKADIRMLENALEQFRLDMFDYPEQDVGLRALVELPAGAENIARYRTGGYIRNLPADPWGRPYLYDYPGENGIVDIYSYGADGQPGGEGTAADIVSWEP